MEFIIYKDGGQINRIAANEAFAAAYCARHGYTYKAAAEPPGPPPEPSLEEVVNTMLGVD